MPAVTVDNPTVQIDLNSGESTTVPAGERFRVSIVIDLNADFAELNGTVIGLSTGGADTKALEIDLFGGDTLSATDGTTLIRGYRVD